MYQFLAVRAETKPVPTQSQLLEKPDINRSPASVAPVDGTWVRRSNNAVLVCSLSRWHLYGPHSRSETPALMTPDERDAVRIGLLKELVAAVQTEHPELSEDVILDRIEDVWLHLVRAVKAGDRAEMEIAASRFPSLSPDGLEEWRWTWHELFALLGGETEGDH